MRLETRMGLPEVPRGDTRVVSFQITEISPEEREILVRYSRPRIDFVPGNEIANAGIWEGAEACSATFETAARAKAHEERVIEMFKKEIARIKEQWTAEGRLGASTLTEA